MSRNETFRYAAAVLCAVCAVQAAGAPSAQRSPASANGPQAVAPAGPARPAPPARMSPPYKPAGVKLVGRTPQQATVQWQVPDQSGGREIQQWQVRACPAVQGNPYAACQPIATPGAGQASGASVQASLPARVLFMGANAAVNAAEICAVNSAGTSCADRLTLQFGTVPAAPAPGIKPLGTGGIRVAPRQADVRPNAAPLGGAPLNVQSAGAAPRSRGIAVKPPSSLSMSPPGPIVDSTVPLRLAVLAPPAPQAIGVNAAALRVSVAAATPLQDISVSANALRLSAGPGAGKLGTKMQAKLPPTGSVIAVDAAPLRVAAASATPAGPIVVNAAALGFKAAASAAPTPISVDAASLRLGVAKPDR